jgi:hypothetical protein
MSSRPAGRGRCTSTATHVSSATGLSDEGSVVLRSFLAKLAKKDAKVAKQNSQLSCSSLARSASFASWREKINHLESTHPLACIGTYLRAPLPISVSTFSGGRPITARAPLTTIGRSIRIGSLTIASIHCASVSVLPAYFTL